MTTATVSPAWASLRLEPLDWLVLVAAVVCLVVIWRDMARVRRAVADAAPVPGE